MSDQKERMKLENCEDGKNDVKKEIKLILYKKKKMKHIFSE